jgi:hypothetical protein
MGELRISTVYTYSILRMFSRLRIFPAPFFSDSDNSLENTQKFYDGRARSFICIRILKSF